MVAQDPQPGLGRKQGSAIKFWNDTEVGVVEHLFAENAARTLEPFREELYSSRFDARRLGLE